MPAPVRWMERNGIPPYEETINYVAVVHGS